MDLGRQFLGRADVLDGVAEMIDEVQVEGHVPGRHQARDRAPSDRGRARRPGAGALRQLPAARRRRRRDRTAGRSRSSGAPGDVLVARRRDRRSTKGARPCELPVTNRGDRPIQVGSHYHFVETNRALVFDRARGLRHAPRHSRRHRRPLRARRNQDRHARRDRRRARDSRRQRLAASGRPGRAEPRPARTLPQDVP